MNAEAGYFTDNKTSWNQLAPVHAASPFYNVPALISDVGSISDVVRFDIPRLPRLEGLQVAHLMCHIGTDTLSLARLGAASVTGLDFSSASLEQARALASATQGSGGERLQFVEGNVYDAVKLLGADKFDMVFTGVGVLSWIPRVKEWAFVIAQLLKPGGKFFIREGHPVLWTVDDKLDKDNPEEQIRLALPYYEQPQPVTFAEGLTYADDSLQTQTSTSRSSDRTHEFNHGMGEIMSALLEAGLRITMFVEHDTVPWMALPGRMVKTGFCQEFELKHKPSKLPLSFTIQATKD